MLNEAPVWRQKQGFSNQISKTHNFRLYDTHVFFKSDEIKNYDSKKSLNGYFVFSTFYCLVFMKSGFRHLIRTKEALCRVFILKLSKP